MYHQTPHSPGVTTTIQPRRSVMRQVTGRVPIVIIGASGSAQNGGANVRRDGMTKPLWAQPVCDPELPADLRLLITRDRPGTEFLAGRTPRSSALRRWRQQRDLVRQSDKIIYPHDLTGSDRLVLARAQNAIDTILGSEVRAAGLLEPDEPALRQPRSS